MIKIQQFLRLFVILLLSTAFIFTCSYYGAEAFGKNNVDGPFISGTTIGYLDVSGKDKSEAASLLEEKYVEWLKGTKINLQYQEKVVPVDLDLFHLDSSRSIESIKNGQQNPAVISIDQSSVDKQLKLLFPQLKTDIFDLSKLTAALTTQASQFETGNFTLNLYNDYLLPDKLKNNAILSSSAIALNGIPEDLQNFIDQYPKIEISADTGFSLIGFVNEKKIKIEPETLDLIATGIYQAILPTNFNIIERNISSSLPVYAKLGYEAKIDLVRKTDLLFSNPNKEKYYLDFDLKGSQLKVTLKGEPLLYTYKISEKDAKVLAPKTIVQYSPLVLPGKIVIQNKGFYGQFINIYRDIYQNNQLLKSELISEDYYPPTYRIEVHALTNSTGTQPASPSTGPQTTNTTDITNQVGTQTTTDSQPVSNETDLWGKPNEQPK